MVPNKIHCKQLMLFFYWKGKNATQMANKICAVYGEIPVVEKSVRKGLLGLKMVISINTEIQERSG